MIQTVIICILLLLAVVAFVISRVVEGQEDRTMTLGVSFGLALLTGIVLVATSFSYVEARTVGIVTEFGKPTGTVRPGLNMLWPWASVTSFPTSKQTLDLDSTDGNGPNVEIKFAGGGEGKVNLNITWRVESDDKAVKLWENWKDFDRVTNDLVSKNVPQNANSVLGTYTPEAAIKGENIEKISEQINAALDKRFIADGIKVDTVSIKTISLSPQIQSRVDRQNQVTTDLETSKIEQERAKIDSETNKIRESSLSDRAQVNKCLEIINSWDVAKNGQLPALLTCGLGGNGQVLVGK